MASKTNRLIALLVAAGLIVAGPSASAFSWPWKKKQAKIETEAQAPAPKKSKYDKFLEKKGLKSAEGFLKIYRDGKDILLEIPDSLIGREVILSTWLEDASEPTMTIGVEVSSCQVFQICKEDSVILFKNPAVRGYEVFADSRLQAVRHRLPAKYSTDSTKVVIVNGVFSPRSKDVLDLAGKKYGDYRILSGSVDDKKSYTRGIVCRGQSVGVESDVTLTLNLQSVLGETSFHPNVTVHIVSCLSPIPQKEFKTRKEDSRVGTLTKPVTAFSPFEGMKTDYMASKWDISYGKSIRVYVDTLFTESWRRAIFEGLQAWNEAFAEAGLGEPVEPVLYSAGLYSGDPMVSTVSFIGGQASSLGLSLLRSADSEILSAKITVPGDYLLGVRRRSVYSISDVDPRYRKYYLDDDAVCEVLKAEVMKTFGRALGLTQNMAGSYAYSPDELRSPSFTAEHGITASVTDDVLFNILAQPGDKEAGVKTIIDRVGDYDKYAIAWLYADAPADFDHLFIPRQDSPSDPRGIQHDLGNDILECARTVRNRLEYVADNAAGWLTSEDVPENYSMLFVDWIYLNYYYMDYYMSDWVGGMLAHETRAGVDLPKLEAVPAELQSRVLQMILKGQSDYSWLDRNPMLFKYLAGANVSIDRYHRTQYVSTVNAFNRLPYVLAAERLAGSKYTADMLLDSLEEAVLADMKDGDLSELREQKAMMYISRLISFSPVMTQNLKEASNQASLADDYSMSSLPISSEYTAELELICYNRLQGLVPKLETIRDKASSTDKLKVDYLLATIKAALTDKSF
ncbi:MAG: zinc-dependent metalloprotease [Bacteroidales bacterium]|nr:zinc-dependent metalloprotease [Bacteroidales bacterium]